MLSVRRGCRAAIGRWDVQHTTLYNSTQLNALLCENSPRHGSHIIASNCGYGLIGSVSSAGEKSHCHHVGTVAIKLQAWCALCDTGEIENFQISKIVPSGNLQKLEEDGMWWVEERERKRNVH